jgi:galactokinase
MICSSFQVVAPGRICFFGEHSDYLGFPVIARAIPLYCTLSVQIKMIANNNNNNNMAKASQSPPPPTTTKPNVVIHLHIPADLGPSKVYDLNNLSPSPPPNHTDSSSSIPIDFALAAIHEIIKEGWDLRPWHLLPSNTTSNNYNGNIEVHCWSSHGELPLQAGCSSSTAFLVAWVLMLAKLANRDLHHHPIRLAQMAHRAEVTHFGHPGGTMDHVSIALGTTNINGTECGALRIGPDPWHVEPLPVLSLASDGVWILADSGEPKDTLQCLRRCKQDRLQLLSDPLMGDWDAEAPSRDLTELEQQLWDTTLINRNSEQEANRLWKQESPSLNDASMGHSLALLMKRHHEALRDGLGLSTPRLEAMNQAALDAGAWGFKVVGSGGGGCAVAWAPTDKADAVAIAMKEVGAVATWVFQSKEPVRGAHYID